MLPLKPSFCRSNPALQGTPSTCSYNWLLNRKGYFNCKAFKFTKYDIGEIMKRVRARENSLDGNRLIGFQMGLSISTVPCNLFDIVEQTFVDYCSLSENYVNVCLPSILYSLRMIYEYNIP